MALHTFRLPDPGEGLVEADIVTWRVAVGDQVKINDILVEVETSKSLVELPTPYAGTVTELLVNEGDTVDVGTPIISIDDGWARHHRPSPTATATRLRCRTWSATGRAPGQPSGAHGAAPGMGRWRRTIRSRTPSPPMLRYRVAPTTGSHCRLSRTRQPAPRCLGRVRRRLRPTPSGGAVLAKPPVRKLAKDLGVDLGAWLAAAPVG